MKAKNSKIVCQIKLQVPAGQANPSPPIGPALGQRGLNIKDFCTQFNDKTKGFEQGMPVPVIITAYADRTFTFVTKTPPTSYLVKKAAALQKGSQTPGRSTAGQIPKAKVEEIAKMKLVDMGIDGIDSAISQVMGTAVSMGIQVVD
ncbi:50S ribosomal protein L11 [Rickettsiales endosymbiont of Peranema trichophorum]|uniref:50S ribosomal protein L11 n=1 Tax=Rickettsiales endosymbiont of Peranema trichophorum TaxID=2486577 RepID=UPI0010233A49|nr:50S ribosomal protein L11 [Rickettsiales endosymbiont of Peranema trichophorum]RZI46720.1 50S ribosomal protein L11 [Rickettsiales endosymbiont of Peranema trichophorum]